MPSFSSALAQSPQLAQVQMGGTVEEVRIEGSERIEPETVRSYLTVQPGDKFDAEKLDKSLKILFATGLFADVTMRRDGNALIVKVVENPIINRVAYEGNDRFDDKALNDEVQLKPRTVYTRTRVQADVKRILDLYRRSGRFAVTVEPKIIQLPQNRVDLVFEITEGKLTGINSINFIGNKAFSNDDLQHQIQTKESRWYRFFSSDDNYDPDRVTYDRELLRKYYLSQGYADFRVVSAVAELTPARDGFIVTFTVDEGERYHFGKIGMNVGLKDLTPAILMPVVTTKEGDWYNADLIEKSIDKLTDAVGDRGYAFIDVRPLITRNRESRTIELTYDIAEGPRVYVERIDVNGNVRTLDRVIRREFQLAEGDAFNTSKVKKSEQNLKNLGFFKKVDVTNAQGSAPDKTVVTVNVEEQSTGDLSIGTGFSTTEGLLGNFGIHERNLLGRGQDLRLNGTISQYNNLLDLSFTEPYFMNRPLAAGFDIFRIQQNNQRLQNYDQYSLGTTFRMGFDLFENIHDTLRYTIRQDQITNISSSASQYVLQQSGTTNESSIGQTLVFDQRDNRLEPTGGYYLQVDDTIAGLGGNIAYVKQIVSGGAYFTWAPKWTLGVVAEYGDVAGLGEGVRLSDRFFIGGDNLRGFANAGIGPRDVTTDDSLGANQYYTIQATQGVPLGLPEELGLTGRVFVDAGAAYGIDVNRIAGEPIADSHQIRVATGVGLSWKSPMGPIKIDLGVPVKKAPHDETEAFRVSFGTKF
ncbi:MAG TPA: outer membrane protein assembly factor BamA [Aliidongia sp.]|uniref:outer membrane protein assembly factor BamA n=1 Tax=Aliidongia sp. TaxID=1914230 RepID=UPI002DDDAEFC|nr:outer membrane protein assembly factor BamA [Aliidongia sp.]HEV2678498.1 outer membrane protein assembly factor BamA [Aliidongia sp.]